eukprot:562550-Pyramimonas_sp.AAC.1
MHMHKDQTPSTGGLVHHQGVPATPYGLSGMEKRDNSATDGSSHGGWPIVSSTTATSLSARNS